MPLTLEQVNKKVKVLRDAARDRDQRMRTVRDIRSGDLDTVIPGAMPDAWPRPIVANLIDTSARDTAEVMGVMPSINCTNSLQVSDRSKKFSSKRTKIAAHYVMMSRLPAGQQIEFCDHYGTYGMAIYSVEPDFDNKTPIIRVEHPIGTYPEFDLFGRLRSFSKVWTEEASSLVAKYPALMKVLRKTNQYGDSDMGWAEREIEVCRYVDDEWIYMFLPAHSGQMISEMPNPMGRLTISIARRPSFDSQVRGAYDDAGWVYLAKSRMALLGLEATEKSVRAPLAIPRDVQKMVFGDNAVLRTEFPEKIRRVGMDIPQAAFQEEQNLERELRLATRNPEARSGQMDASIITGKGVQALMGGFNTVVTTGQQVISEALRVAVSFAFDMDEKLWPSEKKTIRGVVEGSPFEETYVPSKDIGGNHTVDVTYGFAAGQDPARAIVALLQLRSDQLVSRDFVQRNLPMEIDVVQMQQQVDQEAFEDAMKAGVQGAMQAIPQMALQGMDPMDMLMKMAKVIELRNKGKQTHEAVLEAFTPQEAPPGAVQQAPGPMGPGAPQGAPQGAPGPQGQGGGAQDMMRLLTSLKSGGQATMSAQTRRQVAI